MADEKDFHAEGVSLRVSMKMRERILKELKEIFMARGEGKRSR